MYTLAAVPMPLPPSPGGSITPAAPITQSAPRVRVMAPAPDVAALDDAVAREAAALAAEESALAAATAPPPPPPARPAAATAYPYAPATAAASRRGEGWSGVSAVQMSAARGAPAVALTPRGSVSSRQPNTAPTEAWRTRQRELDAEHRARETRMLSHEAAMVAHAALPPTVHVPQAVDVATLRQIRRSIRPASPAGSRGGLGAVGAPPQLSPTSASGGVLLSPAAAAARRRGGSPRAAAAPAAVPVGRAPAHPPPMVAEPPASLLPGSRPSVVSAAVLDRMSHFLATLPPESLTPAMVAKMEAVATSEATQAAAVAAWEAAAGRAPGTLPPPAASPATGGGRMQTVPLYFR